MFNNKKKEIELVFNQYKIAVEMADKISQRRENINKFFLSINSILFALISSNNSFILSYHFFILILWILFSIIWIISISNYRKLNSVKYKIICEIEKKLPIKIYTDEWKELKLDTSYKTLTSIEKIIPILFIIFFLLLLIIKYFFVIKNYFC
jgi:hypothetical protein